MTPKRPVLTRGEVKALLAIAVTALLWAKTGYQLKLLWGLAAMMSALVLVIILLVVLVRPTIRDGVTPAWRRMVLLGIAVAAVLPASAAGRLACRLDFKYRRMASYEALIAAIDWPKPSKTSERVDVLLPRGHKVDALLVQPSLLPNGGYRVDFVWTRNMRYVYCSVESCAHDTVWRYRRLNER